jgi:XTP/dITP diphosphohydrolase
VRVPPEGLRRPAFTRVVIATRNPGKVAEFRSGLAGGPWRPADILSLEDFPGAPEVEETGSTYQENARLKAESALRHTGLPSLGDDSGLEVDALDGAPGLSSARYAGPEADSETRWRKLLDALRDVPDDRRTARFRCVLVLVEPEIVRSGETGVVSAPDDPMTPLSTPIPLSLTFVEGVVEGRIVREPRGKNGFGYDPVFEIAAGGRTMAELPESEKNTLSHRGRALARLREILAARA